LSALILRDFNARLRLMTASSPRLSTAVRTLLVGGFSLESVIRNPGYAVLLMSRQDEFGGVQSYAFAISEERPMSDTEIETAFITAEYHRSQLVVVGTSCEDAPSMDWGRFVNLFGGPVYSSSPLENSFGVQLVDLGHKRVPSGLVGRADDLFEAYVHSALEFVLAGRVIRYGQERRFETRPDGIVLPHDRFRALYDAKAYTDGYPVEADSVRQFRSYVDDFTARYQSYLQRLNAFLVISGKFVQGEQALRERHQEFIAATGVPLSFLTASTLAEIIVLATQYPAARRSVDWARVFAAPIVSLERVRAEFSAIGRDGIIRGS
jgi:hypothetical protein